MEIKLSAEKFGRAGIVGHAGVGHVHSHSGFVQDDSCGFAVVSAILKKACPIDTTIAKISVEGKEITVELACGGKAKADARRGFTPAEKEIAQRAVGMEAIFTQNVGVNTFGRMYGQGALEAPVALQAATALAVMDGFKQAMGDKLVVTSEAIPGKYDKFAGTVVDIDGIPCSIMLVINATHGGIGPDEDYEGNTNYTEKGVMMNALKLDKLPSVIVESKAYIPGMASTVKENGYMVRAEEGVDCKAMADALYAAGQALNLPIRLEEHIMPIAPGALAKGTKGIAEQIIKLGQELAEVDLAIDKVRILADLNALVSQDAGGVTFMSNSVNSLMRGAGTLPGGISTVLSMVTTTEYKNEVLIPQMTKQDLDGYVNIICGAVKSF